MRNLTRVALVVGIGISSTMFATENRTPWIAERGPLRYTFEKLHPEKYNFNSWWVGHYKEAHKAFDKHSVHTKPLSAVIFNKADFKLNEIFPESTVPGDSENYNPFFSVTKFSPRVYYTEYGMTFGARWDYKVWKKGRIGLRGQMPFRTIEMERQDWVDESQDPTNDVKESKYLRIVSKSDGSADKNNIVAVLCNAYNFEFVRNLMDDKNTSIVQATNTGVTIAGNPIQVADQKKMNEIAVAISGTDPVTEGPLFHALNYANVDANRVDDYWDAGTPEVAKDAAYFEPTFRLAGGSKDNTGIAANNALAPFKTDGTGGVSDSSLGFFAKADYLTAKTLDSDAFKKAQSDYWLIFRRQLDSGPGDAEKFGAGEANKSGVGADVAHTIENILLQYKENPFHFISEQGYDLDTQKLSSIGDIDLDLFYEHTFNDSWIGELFVGVRFPTGGDKDCYGTPYRPQTGNGEHWEVKLGAMLAWQPLNWMNAKLDAYYSFALEATEHRMAAFKGATIKNFGPRADADIDWGYFVGRLDFTFFHPKTDNIRAQVGYEFYYKTEDHLNFKQSKMESWLGKKLVNGVLVDNPKDLDKHVAEANTEAIAHKIRGETSVMINKYMEAYVSASTTFAGQHVMRDRDVQGGFNMRF